VEGGHELVFGVEGHLGHARVAAPRLVDVKPALRRQHDERSLGRVADDLAIVDCRVIREGHRQQERVERRIRLPGDAEDLALGGVALAVDRVAPPGNDQLARSHLVQGQRPGLVGADRRGRAERLDRAQPLHDRPLRRKGLRPEREHRRHDRGQAGRDGGDRQADPDQEEVVERLAADEPDQDDERQRRRGHDRDQHRQLVELARERRFLLLDLAQHPRDLADLGVHARRRDDHLAAPAGDGRVHVSHVHAIAERDVVAGDRLDRFQDRRALTGQSRLLDLERRSHEQAPVRRDLVACLEGNDVPGHELLGGNVRNRSVTPHVRLDQEHLLERGDALGGLALLIQAENGVEHRQTEDRDPRRELLERDHAHDRRADEDELHQVPVLAQERVPARLLRLLGELVRPVLRAALLDLGGVEPRLRVDSELSASVIGREAVPRGLSAAALYARLGGRRG
jgi:hypothetical protein